MIVNYSRKNLISVQILCNFCAIFGVTPLYSFEQGRFLKRKTFVAYMALIFLAMIVLEVETVFSIIQIKSFNLVHFVAAMGELFGLLIWSTAIYEVCFKKQAWESFFRNLNSLENMTKLSSPLTREKNVFKNVNFQLLFTITMVVCVLTYEKIVFNHDEKKVFLFNTSYIYFFLHFLLSAVIGNMALLLKNKFYDINQLLSSYENSDATAVIKGTRKVKDLYSIMTEIVDRFNELFGPQLFLMGLHFSSQILQWSVALVYSMFTAKSDQSNDYARLVVGVIYIFLMLIWLGVTMFCCDMAVVESEEIITICYRIQLKYSIFSGPYQSIKNLLYLVNNSKVKFTAMDYYEINRSTMFDLIGTTATYFVVLIQFYDGNKKN